MRTLILGGARSGKSAYAENLVTAGVSGPGAVDYVATGRHDPDDTDWESRIDRHRARRPADWTTVEGDAAEHLRGLDDGRTVLVDDLGTWLTAQIDDAQAWDLPRGSIADRVDDLVDAITRCRGTLVVVSPETGLGVIPETAAGRLFRDELGALNARVAEACDEVALVVAGLPTTLKSASSAAISPAVRTEPAAPQSIPAPVAAAAPAAAPTTVVAGTEARPEPTAGPEAAEFPSITPPDAAVAAQARDRQLLLTKPAGSLGRLEDLSVWVASCQSACPPHDFTRARVVVFAGDHGVARAGVSAYPSEVTGQMVANIVSGGAAVNTIAAVSGAGVRVEDISVETDTAPQVRSHKVCRSSGSIDREDAMTAEQTLAAIAAGRAIADEEVDAGADLLIAGEMGIGNTTPATVLIAALTGTEPVAAVGRGTGVDDAGWMRKTAAIRDALRRARPVLGDPLALLRTSSGADLAAMAGFLAQAAVRRTPVVLDGVVVTASALLAEALAPGAGAWWVAGHRSTEPAHIMALQRLQLEPIIEMDMRLGEGSGALLALPVLRSAIVTLAHMATFESAGVSTEGNTDATRSQATAEPAGDR
ncbi:nicotinate-nucleotide--dimethylbenzimidazole phosphoribosyltransferase [Speluncibacter jeojiensis]|uniref:Nicotinate-nucleotide--dimethylbenzimidazole phosphoribosyltransferase n=1 Tax=Speluncibacter jeojiensis TaxID=2710754 RepID=A0A9X4RC30_9ACTN|nr:nicotinate-nucleotide--dimethylbenzimidazole phosphoribosyltransferase [Corynebacteriales bacterium D3-21]